MNEIEELEKQFSPSRWSKRFPAEEVIQKHVEFITKASDDARKYIPCQLNIPYGSEDREKIDIFGTDLPKDSPIFIYIHGGYWQELSRELSSYVVKPLYKNKFKVIVVGYTLCPQVTLNQITEQIKRAFLKCIEYAKENNSRSLSVGGHSAGAHLTISLFHSLFDSLSLSEQQLLRGLYLISGVYDLTPLVRTYVNDALKLDDVMAKKLSPLHQTFRSNDGKLCKVSFYIIVGENDSPKFQEQSRLFYEKLKNLDYTSKLIIIKSADHFNIVERLNENEYEIIKFIVDK
ncbi:hypothetical protein ILUMI_22007 [Ignelater luminosus]|uniref:Kynurenine formamidase n=1 Tax=Ignelater luminosus TaxID=2038154 RepID=A0A8K0CB04_IGNLU|nr:hypothetical protein ILUMI_22007 [Ignelater luminosus]